MEETNKYQSSPTVAKFVIILAVANLVFLFSEIAFNVIGSILPI